jgi:adenylate cyclase
MAETRKLAAILAADVAGYSRLAAADEERTLARLRALRSDLIDPTIALHHGRVVKRTDDGAIVEFRSVVDAVRCAIEVQNGMVERNAGLQPERRIEFRIGIHLGDVVEESDGDLMGDGVNIAARLEGIAKPGTICLSEQAYWQVKSRLDLAVSDLGATQLKNIAEPVRVYSVEVGNPASLKPVKAAQRNLLMPIIAAVVSLIVIAGVTALYFAGGPKSVAPNAPQPTAASMPAELAKQATPEPPKAPERLSIVVLPFTNLGGDPTQDYLADVITEELISSLSRIAGSFVIARSTAFTYKGKPIDVRQLSRDLGVRYALEGSAQRNGNRVRMTTQLIDAESGAHLWSDQFDANIADLLEMQDEIVKRLSVPLEIRLIDIDAARIARTPPANPDAQDLALQCMAGVIPTLMVEGNHPAFGFCERAVQMDERNAIALTFLSLKYITPVLDMQSTDPPAAIRQAEEFAARALAADRNFYWAHLARAAVLISQKRHEEAIVELEQTLVLNPGFTYAYKLLCEANNYLGKPDRGMEYVDKAIRLSPRDPNLPWSYGEKAWSLLMLQQDDLAIEWLSRTLALRPEAVISRALLASALALTGRQAEASVELKRYLSLKDTTSKTIAEFRPQHRAVSDNPKWLAYSDRLVEGLRKAGMPEE